MPFLLHSQLVSKNNTNKTEKNLKQNFQSFFIILLNLHPVVHLVRVWTMLIGFMSWDICTSSLSPANDKTFGLDQNFPEKMPPLHLQVNLKTRVQNWLILFGFPCC